jgi:hypothetical protein
VTLVNSVVLKSSTPGADIYIMAPVTFWESPGAYINWAARRKPAIFWSLVLGSFGPVFLVSTSLPKSRLLGCELTEYLEQVAVPPVRRYFGDGPRPHIPHTYPSKCLVATDVMQWKWMCAKTGPTVPKGPRKIPDGYDD